MSTDKHKVNIDQLLVDLFKKQAKSLKYKDSILFSKEDAEAGRFKKIAFDLYKVENDPYDGLWMLESIDGIEHLVRASDPQYDSVDNGSWSAISDYDNHSITLAYKNVPITNFFSDEYGYTANDIGVFKTALLDKLEEEEFVASLLKEQPPNKVEALTKTFPELTKFIK